MRNRGVTIIEADLVGVEGRACTPLEAALEAAAYHQSAASDEDQPPPDARLDAAW